MCETNFTNAYHIEIIFHKNIYVGIIYIYINSGDLFNDIFPTGKYDERKPPFILTNTYLVYGWATKLVSVKTSKQKNLQSAVL